MQKSEICTFIGHVGYVIETKCSCSYIAKSAHTQKLTPTLVTNRFGAFRRSDRTRELTVKDFISTVALATHEPGKTASPITCKNDSTLGSVIDTLASKAVHRIYVVAGEDNEALGVVTLRDVISCFITEPPDFFDHYFGFDAKEILSK